MELQRDLARASRSRLINTASRRQGFHLQERDVDVLLDVFTFGAMTRTQIQQRHFGSVQRCNMRLLRLADARLLCRTRLPVPLAIQTASCPLIYTIGSAAVPIMSAALGWEPSAVRARQRNGTPAHLTHSLEIVQLWLNLREEVDSRSDVHVTDFLPEVLIRHAYEYRTADSSEWRHEVFKPDALIRLRRSGEDAAVYYFIELDLGHTASGQFLNKLRIHTRYLESGLFAKTYADASGPKSFRALYITTTDVRLEHLRKLAHASGDSLFLFATLSEIRSRGMLSAIWRGSDLDECRALL